MPLYSARSCASIFHKLLKMNLRLFLGVIHFSKSWKKSLQTMYSSFNNCLERTTVQTSSAYLQSMDFQREPQSKHHLYILDCCFFTSWPTRPISLTLTQTPTPADSVVPIHSWRLLGHSTVWADFVCVSGSVLYLVRTQSKK